MKIFIGSLLGVVLIYGIGVVFSDLTSRTLIVERAGIRLVIPSKYVVKSRFWWIKFAHGLDTSDGSVLIKMPTTEIRSLLPSDAPLPANFVTLIYLLDKKEQTQFVQEVQNTALDVDKRRGRYVELTMEKDNFSDWFRIYGQYADIFGWLVVKQKPPISGDDIVASCIKPNGAVLIECKLSKFIVDGIGVETSIRAEHLRYSEIIKNHIAQLLRSWRASSNTGRAE
ncbi:MAG: hypothetical protein IRZ06_11180 [Nevskia sp.]|nr:hypothetical protein [Nevskia sp.]